MQYTCTCIHVCVAYDHTQLCDGSNNNCYQVVHGSGPIAANLQSQFGIFLENIFDTQVCFHLYFNSKCQM